MGGLNAIGSDINNDRAVDLVTAQVTLNPIVYSNPREGKFVRLKIPRDTNSGGAHGLAVLDFDHDGWMDIAFTQSGEPGLMLWRNHLGNNFEPVNLPETNWVRAFGVVAFDYDNDGWVDLAAVGETKDGTRTKSASFAISAPTAGKTSPPMSASTKFNSKSRAPSLPEITTTTAQSIC